MTYDIIHSIDIAAKPETLYKALTTQQGLAAWWTPNAKAEARVGALNEFYFDDFLLRFRVEKLVPMRQVVWSSVEVPPNWEGTSVTFDISPYGELVFRHSGFSSTESGFGKTSYFWAQYVRSIKMLLETGEGEPYGSKGSRLAGTS